MKERIIDNLFNETSYIIVFLLFFMSPEDIRSWDLAVASDGALNLFDIDGQIESKPAETIQFTDLYALAYDPIHERLFFSVNEHNSSIYTFDLSNHSLTPIVPRQSHEVQGIAYDVTTTTLFWTDGNGRSIWKRSLLNESTTPEVVLRLKDEIPMGIAVSYCKRLLFWANSNHLNASIDRANLDGSNQVQLITADVFQPLGITIDEPYGKLYWTDDQKGIFYRIERSNLDGSDRELVLRRTHQEPFGIATLHNAIYWTDTIQKNIWMISTDMSFPNHTKAKLEPDIFYDYKHSQPNGIVAFSNGTFECNLLFKVPKPKIEIAHDEPQIKTDSEYCLNSGAYKFDSCKCKPGYFGTRCENYVCNNFCLYGGQCYLDKGGYPECRCLPGYEGNRCQKDLCDDFCLNGGRCHINESVPLCACGEGYNGQRCEIPSEANCQKSCPSCDCDLTRLQYNATGEHFESLYAGACEEQRILIICLTCFAATSMLAIALLARKVCVLRRRPRIKKRIIVNKAVKSQTPLTARPHPSPATEQCEITIENCCNMNICETPCFEPNLRSSRSSSSSSTKKTEDRKNLLKNMEEEPGGSDVSYS